MCLGIFSGQCLLVAKADIVWDRDPAAILSAARSAGQLQGRVETLLNDGHSA